MSYTPQDRPPAGAGQSLSVIVKLREQRSAPLVAAVAPSGGGQGGGRPRDAEPLWQRVQQQYPGVTIERALQGVDPEQVARAQREAGGTEATADLNRFYRIRLPANARGADVVNFVQTGANRELVESAYVDVGVIPAKIEPTNDPKFKDQHYIRGRRKGRRGIFANFAWDKPGGDGTGIGIVFVEMGWQLDHEDLVDAKVSLISGINGTNAGNREHGTNCLGEVMGQDNTKGIVGVAPKARGRVVSTERTAGNHNTQAAILSGILAMSRGDVMSISLQTGAFQPLEIRELDYLVIRLGTLLGRIICTAAGNGAIDLDTITDAAGKLVLKRGHADFRNSGAIMVAAATETRPHDKVAASNFGSRIDCFAQGRNITTTSTKAAKYIDDFRNTSGATPIIAGAAVLTQSMAKKRTGSPLSVAAVRSALSGTASSVRSRNGATDRIGRMPNMCLIFHKVIEKLRSPAARTHEVMPTEAPVYLDAGHGGDMDEGRSSAYGGSGALGIHEKDIALNFAERVQAHYGGPSTLSRTGDYNLSLRSRVDAAHRSGAAAFVSLHAHTGVSQNAGPEVWVYGQPGAAPDVSSTLLAERISREIGNVYGRRVPIREGRLAVLDPAAHRRPVAACLVEAGSLADPVDERRLTDAGTIDAIGAAVARGMQHYMGDVTTDTDEIDDEDTQYETPARAHGADDSSADDTEYGIQDMAQAYSDMPADSGDATDYDAY